MELFNPRIPSGPSIFPRIPIFCSNFSITSQKKKNPSRLGIPCSKLPLHITFSPYSASRNFRISAHFGRPTSRRNHLREKLTERQEQVHHSPSISNEPASDFQYPVHKLDDNDGFQFKSDCDGVKDRSFSPNSGVVSDIDVSDNVQDSKSKLSWDKWFDQFVKDSKFWDFGSQHIFTVFHDSGGKVQRVVVNEDEILRRIPFGSSLDKQSERKDLTEVNSKITYAKCLAREMEKGNIMLPKNSVVAKFSYSGERLGFVHMIRNAAFQSALFSKWSNIGIIVLCGFFVIYAVKNLFTTGKDVKEYTRLEKEMLRRKMKARKDNLVKGTVKVIQEPKGQEISSLKRPQLDRQAVMDKFFKAKAINDGLALPEMSGTQAASSMEFDYKIMEIRAMAKQVRELEQKEHLPDNGDRKDDETIQQHEDEAVSLSSDLSDGYSGQNMELISSDDCKVDGAGFFSGIAFCERNDGQSSTALKAEASNDSDHSIGKVADEACSSNSLHAVEVSQTSDISFGQSCNSRRKSERAKQKVILSIKEAREYLDKKRNKQERNQGHKVRDFQQDEVLSSPNEAETGDNKNQRFYKNDNDFTPSTSTGTFDMKYPTNVSKDSSLEKIRFSSSEAVEEEDMMVGLQIPPASIAHESSKELRSSVPMLTSDEEKHSNINDNLRNDNIFEPAFAVGKSGPTSSSLSCENLVLNAEEATSTRNHHPRDPREETEADDLQGPETSTSDGRDIRDEDAILSVKKDKWLEKNYHEFEPIVKKVGVGFRDNYAAARRSTNEESDIEMFQLKSDEDSNELEWMKDDKLREIVFQVRENELAGRDPFYLMKDEDKAAFFTGLEKKVEKENQNLSRLHEWLHSNIENLDYGADGVSLYDPPEKIIPRWKGPPIEKNPEFLSSFVQQKQSLVKSARNSLFVKNDKKDSSMESKEFQSRYHVPLTLPIYNQNTKIQDESLKTPKTVIEGSDGSVRAGKISGKEYWQHTKKWSRGFLESYNAEQDPGIKATMRNIGKDLDRWITEKEIKEAADLMNKIPERGRKFIEGKLNKVSREMELFGPQAVVSKYREYADEEEDYLWWLDLPFVLCIELYTEGGQKTEVGFYSLEMAADLELEPKQYHVIAFEDAGDCKNLCYIIQAHMEMLGSGSAFVVARPPKDAFREAKANGFSVTVIRKGELRLNVDQTLEEVEEQIIEIGSKIYHDKVTREHSVDISSIMKGVFGTSKPIKRKRSKRKLKKRTKRQ